MASHPQTMSYGQTRNVTQEEVSKFMCKCETLFILSVISITEDSSFPSKRNQTAMQAAIFSLYAKCKFHFPCPGEHVIDAQR